MADIWRHGKYVDLWSLVHFLSGFLLAGLFYRMGSDFLEALLYSTLLLIAWEAFEWLTKIIEPSINVLADIVIGLAGFCIGAYLYYALQIPFNATFYPGLLITAVLSAWGFLDFLKRGYR